MSKIVFLSMSDYRTVEVKFDGDVTWMKVADEFMCFLHGCGYQVSPAEIADYLQGEYGSQAPIAEFDVDTSSLTIDKVWFGNV